MVEKDFRKEVFQVRNINRCELFSKLCGADIPCSYPDLRCGFKFYTDKYGNTLGMCQHRVKDLGFEECVKEMRVLFTWKMKKEKCWEADLQYEGTPI